MSTYHILYNRMSKSNTGELEAHMLDEIMAGEKLKYWNVTEIDNYDDFFAEIPADDKIIVAGGDGSLHKFINRTDNCNVPQDVYFFPAGSGNDFARDFGKKKHCEPYDVRPYISNLPEADIDGNKHRFFNSISIGLDAQVCMEANRLKKAGKKSVNYALLAVKCIFTKYNFCDAVVTFEDGSKKEYKDVLLAITTKGRYFGGGVKISPNQDRNHPDEEMILIVAHGLSAFKALIVFASIVIGKHFSFKNNVIEIRGKHFEVEFSRPTPIQVDGETIDGKTGYRAYAKHTVDLK